MLEPPTHHRPQQPPPEEPAEPVEPVRSTESTEPTEPAEPAEPVRSTESTRSTEPADPVESGAEPVDPADPPVADAAAEARGLRWLHLLVLLALAAVGVGAGDAVFVVHDLGRWGEVQACAALHDLPPDGGQIARLLGRGDVYETCEAGFEANRYAARLGGAVAMLLLAGLCVILGGLWLRLRLGGRVRRQPPDGEATATITGRFEYWCGALGLTGRRRPGLVVAPWGRIDGEAYTTSVPFGRPVVVVPVAHAYGREDVLDLVLLHELAHVRARDVSWASATWWAGWLAVPVLLLAMAPVLVEPAAVTGSYVRSLPIAVALAVAALVLRAAVLRRREHAADRFAVARGDLGNALKAATGVDDDTPTRPPARRWAPRSGLRRLLATHPPKPERASAVNRSAGWEGGFGVAAAIGLLAMFTFQTIERLLLGVADSLPSAGSVDVEPAVLGAALVWAAAVLPIWARHPAPNRRNWWARVAGSTSGLVAGYLLPGYGEEAPLHGVFMVGFVPGVLGWAVLLLAGVSAIGAGLAEALAAVPRGVRRAVAGTCAVLGMTMLLGTVLDTATLVLFGHWAWRSVPIDRALWNTPNGLFRTWTPGVMLLVTAVLLALRGGAPRSPTGAAPSPPAGATSPAPAGPTPTTPAGPTTATPAGLAPTTPAGLVPATPAGGTGLAATGTNTGAADRAWSVRRLVVLVLLAVCVGSVAASVASPVLADRVAADGAFFLLFNRWWMCAATGWLVVLVVLLTTGAQVRTGGIAVAWLAGAVTTALTGAGQYLRDVLVGVRHDLDHLTSFVQRPWWLLTALIVLSMPVTVLLSDVLAVIRARVRYADRPVRRRFWPVATASTVGVVAAVCVIVLGSATALTGEAGDWDRLQAARIEPGAPDGNRVRPIGADPGRLLSQASVDALLAEARRGLPPEWQVSSIPTETGAEELAGMRPQSCADRLVARRQVQRDLGPVADGTIVLTVPPDTLPPLGATLGFALTSYRSRDAGRQLLAEADAELANCPRWSVPAPLSDDQRSHLSAVAIAPPDLPHQSLQTRLTNSSSVGGLPAVVGGARVVLGVGHNVLTVEIARGIPFRDQLDPKEQILLDDLAVRTARLIAHALDTARARTDR
ncbi:M48 family metalloprotease [Plantactinospora endophytica]|uniref:Peptidase M48 domain-containing protein n=1 Tax=Plantactinospora endophytica TaxID=673535 RepID=A0ABQ4EAP1_9ACTN|nr:hypothetical protein Pen02_66660 [Plantactinospora endophytica]